MEKRVAKAYGVQTPKDSKTRGIKSPPLLATHCPNTGCPHWQQQPPQPEKRNKKYKK